MLKLTNSFYRYLTVTCERVDYRTHVIKYCHPNCLKEICRTDCINLHLKRQLHCDEIIKKRGNTKKRPSIRIPPLNTNEFVRMDQTMDQEQPTNNHASCGGSFVISSDEESDDWRKNTKSPSGVDRRPSRIPMNFRYWESVSKRRDSFGGSGSGGSFHFKVMSYNVLAQYLLECHPYLYTECCPRDLKWKVRSARLYDEIASLSPDILCLQEVQVSHLTSFYSKFEKIGYQGMFKQKTGHRQDGCAIYFKKSVFDMKDSNTVEFYQPDLPLLNRDNIGLMVKLAPRQAPHNPIIVATTHLLYNPKRTDVRLAQMQVFLAEMDRFSFFNNGNECGRLPIILTGDFNSTPESAVLRLLDSGFVSAKPYRDSSDWQKIEVTDNCQHLSVFLDRQKGQHTDFRNVKIFHSEYSEKSSTAEAAVEDVPRENLPPEGRFNEFFNSGNLWHSLQLASVYDKYRPDGSHEASTFQDYWVTVDYIYFSCCSNLRLTDRLRLPTAAECSALHRLPNEVYASDHLALAAAFEIYPVKPTNVGRAGRSFL